MSTADLFGRSKAPEQNVQLIP